MLGISKWDKSDNKFAVTDTTLAEISKFGIRSKDYDPNFSFPCCGFSLADGYFQYNNPIDDNVSLVKGNEYAGEYLFDFGSKRVPDEIRINIEAHLKELAGYSFLANAVGVYDDKVILSGYDENSGKTLIAYVSADSILKSIKM